MQAVSSIRNLRTRHEVVTGDALDMAVKQYILQLMKGNCFKVCNILKIIFIGHSSL
jgi:hypothetical protein